MTDKPSDLATMANALLLFEGPGLRIERLSDGGIIVATRDSTHMLCPTDARTVLSVWFGQECGRAPPRLATLNGARVQ